MQRTQLFISFNRRKTAGKEKGLPITQKCMRDSSTFGKRRLVSGTRRNEFDDSQKTHFVLFQMGQIFSRFREIQSHFVFQKQAMIMSVMLSRA